MIVRICYVKGGILQVHGRYYGSMKTIKLDNCLDGCHTLFMVRKSWSDATEFCSKIGGYLARPSKRVNNAIKFQLDDSVIRESVWFSLAKTANEWNYIRPNSLFREKLEFTDWARGRRILKS